MTLRQFPSSPATRYLTFNNALPEKADLNEYIKDEAAPTGGLPLQYVWHVWEQIQNDNKSQRYEDNTRNLAVFDTVQKFWQLWAYMPQPSELLDHKRMVRQDTSGRNHVVDALMIFKEGIQPMWEDPLNANGGHFEFKLMGHVSGAQVDEYWNNLVLGLVGATIESIDYITGVRLVDKLSQPRSPCIRIEIWFRKCDRHTQDQLFQEVSNCMSMKLDGSKGNHLRGDVKAHSRF